jgi:hypothetical protein
MPVYKLKAKSNYGNMPKGYEFQVVSTSSPTPNRSEVEKEIARLGFNSDAQKYGSSGNFDIIK